MCDMKRGVRGAFGSTETRKESGEESIEQVMGGRQNTSKSIREVQSSTIERKVTWGYDREKVQRTDMEG